MTTCPYCNKPMYESRGMALCTDSINCGYTSRLESAEFERWFAKVQYAYVNLSDGADVADRDDDDVRALFEAGIDPEEAALETYLEGE